MSSSARHTFPQGVSRIVRHRLLVNFFRVYRLDRWIRERLTVTGKIMFATLVFATVFGINTRLNLSYQLASLALGLVLAAAISSIWFGAKLTARRRLPRFATVGEPLRYTVRVRNRGRGAQRGLLISERFNPRFPSVDEFRGFKPDSATQVNRFDRMIGYPRWMSLMRHRVGVLVKERLIKDVSSEGHTEIDMELTPLRRGYVELRELAVARLDPLGLFKSLVKLTVEDRLLVLPKRYPVAPLRFDGGDDHRDRDQARPELGGNDEFASTREYRPSDPIRHLDWKAWARTGQPVIKEFHDVGVRRNAVVLDTALPSHMDPAVFETAVSVAASLIGVADQGEAPDKLFVGAHGHGVGGHAQSSHLLEALACAQYEPEDQFPLTRRAVLQSGPELGGCICVLLAADLDRQDFLKALGHAGIPLVAILVSPRHVEALDVPEYLQRVYVDSVAVDLMSLVSRGGA